MKLREVLPVAQRIVNSSILYQGFERPILADGDRWSPPGPVVLDRANINSYSPSSLPTAAERWAVKYNKLVMKACKKASAEGQLAILVYGYNENDEAASPDVFSLCGACKNSWTIVAHAGDSSAFYSR